MLTHHPQLLRQLRSGIAWLRCWQVNGRGEAEGLEHRAACMHAAPAQCQHTCLAILAASALHSRHALLAERCQVFWSVFKHLLAGAEQEGRSAALQRATREAS